AMPFILFSGWILSGVEANPGDTALGAAAAVLTALGFGLLLGVFPFNSWIPMLAEETQPYASAYVFFILSLAVSLFGLNFLERYNWFYTSPWLLIYLRLSGFLMVVAGGLGAMFQRNLGRLMGYAVTLEVGLSLLAISLGVGVEANRPALSVFFTLLLPRVLSLGIMGLAIAIIRTHTGGMNFDQLRGVFQRLPYAWFGLFAATLTLVGFPLTAGFPAHLALWQGLAARFPLVNYAALFGSMGLLFGGLRVLVVTLSDGSGVDDQPLESRGQRFFLAIGGLALFVIGLFPQWFFPALVRMATLYLRLE
ncbi:MAG: proton-conducting transporter membrane subunit, partial [Anaerolineales bacterium]|nr:proton-conducting transporter membrane subunit [Anaerolineales bacterium]